MADADTIVQHGTFRGTIRVVFYVGRTNGFVVLMSDAGEFISAWHLSEDQMGNVLDRSRL